MYEPGDQRRKLKMDDSTKYRDLAVPSDGQSSEANRSAYWRANLKIMMGLLVIWFSVSFGCGILLADAQRFNSLVGKVLVLAARGYLCVCHPDLVYVALMNRLDRRFDSWGG